MFDPQHTTLRGLLTHRCGPECGAGFAAPTGDPVLDRVVEWRREADEWVTLGLRPSRLRTVALVLGLCGAVVGAVVYSLLGRSSPLVGALGGAILGGFVVPTLLWALVIPVRLVLGIAAWVLTRRHRRRAGPLSPG